MTISLLRRIWQRIHAESVAPSPKQRLTGFEPLEPRMVLSGFVAFYTPDYFSPPPGDFSHIERSGAEIARPMVEFDAYGDGNAFGRGFGQHGEDDRSLVGRGNDTWLSATPYSSPLNSPGTSELPQLSVEMGDASYEIDDESSSSVTIINIPAARPPTSITYISISPEAADRFVATLASSNSFAFTPMAAMSTMSPMASSFRSLTDRDYTAVSAGGAVERHEDAHDYAATHGTAPNASLALVLRPAAVVERSGTNLPGDAALASQSALGVNSTMVQSTDGSIANGQSGAASDGSANQEQNGLLELSEGERLNLKRKLAGGAATLEEAARSTTSRGDQYSEGDAQFSYDATRPFDVTAAPNGQLRLAAASLADDGLIEVLAADVTTVIASGEVNGQAAANHQIAMEPAVATYQAFETIVDGGSQAADIASDAARLAVAMNAQPVVQAE